MDWESVGLALFVVGLCVACYLWGYNDGRRKG